MAGVHAIILAAGLSSRMGAENKLTKTWHGLPLVTHVARSALASRLQQVVVVTGHEAREVEACLPQGCGLTHNGDYANGMAGSLRAGMYRLQRHTAFMVLLGDMPLVTAKHIDALIAAFEEAQDDKAIVVATAGGEWGNPVIFGKHWFTDLKILDGDRGARWVIEQNRHDVTEVEIGNAARRDFDQPTDFS